MSLVLRILVVNTLCIRMVNCLLALVVMSRLFGFNIDLIVDDESALLGKGPLQRQRWC